MLFLIRVAAFVGAKSLSQNKYISHHVPFTPHQQGKVTTTYNQIAKLERYLHVSNILDLRGGASDRDYSSNSRRESYDYGDEYYQRGDGDRYYDDKGYDKGYEYNQRNADTYNDGDNYGEYRDYYEEDMRPKPLVSSESSFEYLNFSAH